LRCQPLKCRIGRNPDDHEVAAWLAAHTDGDARQVEAELAVGERRRAFVVDELIDAGFTGAELVELTLRLTGLAPAEANALIRARVALGAGPEKPRVRERDRRLAENEIMFRQVNERLASTDAGHSPLDEIVLVCECSDRSCLKTFEIERAEYEWLRQDPHRFAVLPGHDAPAVEVIVERHDRFAVVEKRAETHDQVEATDPRA
jgi:hypothetical protein